MVSSGKSFQEVVENTKNIEGVKHDFYAKFGDKKGKKGGSLCGSYSKRLVPLAPVSQGYS